MLYNGWRYPPFKLLEAGVNVIDWISIPIFRQLEVPSYVSYVPKLFRVIKNTERFNFFLFPGSAGGGVASGEVNETIQLFLGSFARESFGTARNFCIVLRWFLFHCTEWIVGSVMIFYSHRKVTK